jgi:hypothetical protein
VTSNSPRRCVEEDFASYIKAGYAASQALEVVLGVGLKMLSNDATTFAEPRLACWFAFVAWKPANGRFAAVESA